MSLIRRVLRGADGVLGRAALEHLRQRDVALVLLYHRIDLEEDPTYPPLPPSVFERHCAFVRDSFEVVRLGELADRLRQGRSLRGYCAITFDDGYRDFLVHAYPILQRYRIPVTHFLVAHSVLSGRATFNLRLKHLLYSSSRGTTKYLADGASNSERELALRLGRMRSSEREAWLQDQEGRITSALKEPPMLRSQDLRTVDPELVEWGSHTLSHGLLPGAGPEVVREELGESRRQLEALTGRPVRFLAYPNGQYTENVRQAAAACGYEVALAGDGSSVTPQSNLYGLPRFDVGAMPVHMLRLELSGMLGAARTLRSRLMRQRLSSSGETLPMGWTS